MDKDTPLFDDKTFSDLLRDVYSNTKKKETQESFQINHIVKTVFKPLVCFIRV